MSQFKRTTSVSVTAEINKVTKTGAIVKSPIFAWCRRPIDRRPTKQAKAEAWPVGDAEHLGRLRFSDLREWTS
jgi:hypothetical protein